MIWQNELGYLDLLNHTLRFGTMTPDRTGVGRIRVFGQVLEFDLKDWSFPIFNHRPMPYRHAFEEFWFFLNGGTNTKELEEKGVKFWQGNTSKDFLQKRGLGHLAEGSYGKAYGFQLRHFNGKLLDDEAWDGVDQIRNLVKGLQEDPYGARHVVTMWNPSQLDEMALPPCWYDHQFVMTTYDEWNVLNLRVTARSADLLFGTPANCFQYGVYLMAMASLLEVAPGTLTIMIGDAHIYGNQIDYVCETLTRRKDVDETLVKAVQWDHEIESVEELLALKWDDIMLRGYEPIRTPYKTPKPPMAV